tara:strand:- start:1131 stop:1352 length:222 start_codon:yes stop_codon:yes gene_type:complete
MNQICRIMAHKWVVMFEPFDDEGFEYVRIGKVWDMNTPIKVFTNRDEAEKEKRKWNTGVVTEWRNEDVNYKEH